jgi:hypothetical protein
VFGRNLYDTDEQNSIPENERTLYCTMFKKKPSVLTVADF